MNRITLLANIVEDLFVEIEVQEPNLTELLTKLQAIDSALAIKWKLEQIERTRR